MKHPLLAVTLVAAFSSLSSAQERPVPKDSTRLSISGCANGRVFTVGRDPEHEAPPVIELGAKVRLEGDKKVLAEVKKHEGSMVEVTGLMKQSDVVQPGIGLAGGRVRIAPVMPSSRGPAVAPPPPAPILDVESYRLLNASCQKR
jgi:hypothetical protein